MSDFKTIATAMAQRGIAVTPTYPGLRFPAMTGWNGQDTWYAATTDLKTIEAWAKENPNYNCCCVAKNDGAYMLDIDDLAAAQKRGMPELPRTLTSKTPGGGLHVFLQHTAISRGLGNANVYEGEGKARKKVVEVKGHNVAVCAPGCTRDDGGAYKIVLDAPLAQMPVELCEWLTREAETVKPTTASGAGKRRAFHPDFERDDLHEHFGWEFASDEPFVQRDGAEYYTFLTCPVCDRELDADDIKSRRCCLIYGNYGVSFNCVWCGDAVRWPELMAAMEAKGTAEYPYFIYENDDDELVLNKASFPIAEPEEAQETVAETSADLHKKKMIEAFLRVFPNAVEVKTEELTEVLNRLPNDKAAEVQKAWDVAREGLVEIRKGIEVYEDEDGKEKNRKKHRHIIDDEILNYIRQIMREVMEARYFVDAYPHIFLPLENTVYKFHNSEDAFRILSRFGLRLTQHDYKLAEENLHHEILMYGEKTHIEKFGCMRGEAIYVNDGRGGIIKITTDAFLEVPNGTDNVYMLNKHLLPWPALDKERLTKIAEQLDGRGGQVTDNSKLCQHLNAYFDEGKLTNRQYQQLVILRYLSLFLGLAIDLRPVMMSLGVQNSGKSTLWEKFMWLFYGVKYESGGLPTNLRSFIAAITNHQIQLFDNIDSAPFDNAKTDYPAYIDLMCKCSSGGKISIAQLYENNVDKDFELRCDLFLTSRINPFPSHRSDLLRRMQIFPVRLPSKEEYRTTESIKRALAADTYEIKLETLVRLQLILRALVANKDKDWAPVSQMHSYETFTMQIADYEGWRPEMEAIWEGYYGEYQERLTEDSPLVNFVRRWLGKEGNVGRRVRTGQMYRELEDAYGRAFTQNWRTDAAFGRRLKENFSALGLLGIKKMFKDGGTTYWFEPTPEQVGVCKNAYADSMTRWARELADVTEPEDVW